MDSELPCFLVWSLCIKCLVHHEVYSVSWSCLLSFLCNPYIPFQIYEIFYLLVVINSPWGQIIIPHMQGDTVALICCPKIGNGLAMIEVSVLPI